MNLKLFQQECAKRILIVLRDFDERHDVKERITEMILNDIKNIWREIKKPEKFRDYTPDRFFEFEFSTLPHKLYFEDKFMQEIREMRKRLTPDNNSYLFRHVSEEKQVPLEGLSLYCMKIWEDIISNKDLNIPSQKEMLANYKCNEIKELAFLSIEAEVESFLAETSSKSIIDFKSKCESLQTKILSFYDETAKIYIKHVYADIRRQMIIQLSQRLYVGFDNQAKKLIPVFQKNMNNELQSELKKSKNYKIN